MVHMRKVLVAPDVNAQRVGARYARHVRCRLANLVNEAALSRTSRQALRRDGRFRAAKDKIFMGASALDGDAGRRAPQHGYHESGHAVVAKLMPKTDRCTKSPLFRADVRWIDHALPSKTLQYG